MAGMLARFTMMNSKGLYPSMMNGTGTRRKKRAKVAPLVKRGKKRAKVARAGRPARLVKGSAAAKAYMAKIRRKRR